MRMLWADQHRNVLSTLVGRATGAIHADYAIKSTFADFAKAADKAKTAIRAKIFPTQITAYTLYQNQRNALSAADT